MHGLTDSRRKWLMLNYFIVFVRRNDELITKRIAPRLMSQTYKPNIYANDCDHALRAMRGRYSFLPKATAIRSLQQFL
jgi:hypothetical protein